MLVSGPTQLVLGVADGADGGVHAVIEQPLQCHARDGVVALVIAIGRAMVVRSRTSRGSWPSGV
jgi:hypothetical protein